MTYWNSLLQTIYMAILNPLFNLTAKLKESTRLFIIRMLFVFVFIYFILFFDRNLCWWGVDRILLKSNIFATVILLLVAILSINEPLKPIKWRGSVSWMTFLCGSGLVVTGLIHPIGDGYMSFGFMLLFLYPCFYFVWNNRRDYGTLFTSVTKAFVLVGTCYFIWSALQGIINGRIFSVRRFRGTMLNSNLYSMAGMMMAFAALYLWYTNKGNSKRILFYLIILTTGTEMVLLGQSRICILATVINILITLYALLRYDVHFKDIKEKCSAFFRKGVDKERLKKIVLCSLIALLIFGAVFAVMNHSPSEQKEEKQVEMRWVKRFLPREKNLNKYTSGRINIWTNYGRHLNLLGNNYEETNWEELTNNKVRHAHNNFFEYGYRSGIIVATFFTLLGLLAGIIALRYLFFNKERRKYLLFPVMCLVIYSLESIFDIATVPMERYAPFFFYLALCPMMDRRV